jgi:hypothetical protein
MNPVPRSTSQKDKDLIQEYLDNGGTVDVRANGERSEEIEFNGGFYKKRKKKIDSETKDQ